MVNTVRLSLELGLGLKLRFAVEFTLLKSAIKSTEATVRAIWQGGKVSGCKTVRPRFDSQQVQGFFKLPYTL